MSVENVSDAVGKLVTPEWIKSTAAKYFENANKLDDEGCLAVRASFVSDTMRGRFKPDMESLESGCAVYLKMTCRKLIQEKIANHMREEAMG